MCRKPYSEIRTKVHKHRSQDIAQHLTPPYLIHSISEPNSSHQVVSRQTSCFWFFTEIALWEIIIYLQSQSVFFPFSTRVNLHAKKFNVLIFVNEADFLLASWFGISINLQNLWELRRTPTMSLECVHRTRKDLTRSQLQLNFFLEKVSHSFQALT